jgi:hypothetical protein
MHNGFVLLARCACLIDPDLALGPAAQALACREQWLRWHVAWVSDAYSPAAANARLVGHGKPEPDFADHSHPRIATVSIAAHVSAAMISRVQKLLPLASAVAHASSHVALSGVRSAVQFNSAARSQACSHV